MRAPVTCNATAELHQCWPPVENSTGCIGAGRVPSFSGRPFTSGLCTRFPVRLGPKLITTSNEAQASRATRACKGSSVVCGPLNARCCGLLRYLRFVTAGSCEHLANCQACDHS